MPASQRVIRLTSAAATLLCGGCAEVTAPLLSTDLLEFTFQAPATIASKEPERPGVWLFGQPDGVRVEGWYGSPSGGYTLTAELTHSDTSYVLEVTGTQTSPGIGIMVHQSYRAAILGLPMGRYRVDVRYDGRPVFSDFVRVP